MFTTLLYYVDKVYCQKGHFPSKTELIICN